MVVQKPGDMTTRIRWFAPRTAKSGVVVKTPTGQRPAIDISPAFRYLPEAHAVARYLNLDVPPDITWNLRGLFLRISSEYLEYPHKGSSSVTAVIRPAI